MASKWTAVSAKVCVECDQVVYPLEQVVVGQFVYHKWCFRCAQCNRVLSLSSYAVAPSGIPYCKPHYASTMKRRGRYEDFAVARVTSTDDLTAIANPVESGNVRYITSTVPRPIEAINRNNKPSVSSSSGGLRNGSSSSSSSFSDDDVYVRACSGHRGCGGDCCDISSYAVAILESTHL